MLVAPYPRDVQALARATRALMLELLPKVEGTVDPSGPYISYGYAPGYKGVVSYITVNQKGVKLGVAGGARFRIRRSSFRERANAIVTSSSARQPIFVRPVCVSSFALRSAAWKKDRA